MRVLGQHMSILVFAEGFIDPVKSLFEILHIM